MFLSQCQPFSSSAIAFSTFLKRSQAVAPALQACEFGLGFLLTPHPACVSTVDTAGCSWPTVFCNRVKEGWRRRSHRSCPAPCRRRGRLPQARGGKAPVGRWFCDGRGPLCAPGSMSGSATDRATLLVATVTSCASVPVIEVQFAEIVKQGSRGRVSISHQRSASPGRCPSGTVARGRAHPGSACASP